jgi:hypothetical protein
MSEERLNLYRILCTRDNKTSNKTFLMSLFCLVLVPLKRVTPDGLSEALSPLNVILVWP